ncbi:MAG TPA: amidohydrolase family protein [Xanthobacteraceae bacterium]
MSNRESITSGVPRCAPPDPAPRPPHAGFPPLACDCHAHICGPQATYGYIPERIYTPPDALPPAYRHLLATLGCGRAVLVQPSFYGADNRAMLAAMREAGARFRGVAVLGDDASEREIAALHDAGVRGARLNIVDVKTGKGELPLAHIERLADRIKAFGWHIEFLMHVDEFPELDRMLGRLPVECVFGHLGYVRADKGTVTPGFEALLRLVRAGRAWVKLTGPYRISTGPLPHADTQAFAQALVEAAPDRLVWGSDWPHVKAEWAIAMPNDGELADLLAAWVPDEGLRKRVLVDNPARLYGFA